MTDQQVATRPVRQYIEVIDPIPIFDSAKFEQMGRVALAMARMTLIPDHLKVVVDGQFDLERTAANCLMIVNQSMNWGADPLAVAQCTSMVYGRLCYEGKLVNAVFEKKLGVRLIYEWFGTPGTDSHGIKITHPDNPEETITGTVGDWKTTEKSGAIKANWSGQHQKIQLKYRGDREWSRAWATGLLLGIYTPDEFNDLADDARARRAQPAGTGLAGRLSSTVPQNGLSQAKIEQDTRPEAKIETKLETKVDPEVKAEVKPEPKAEVKPEVKAADKPEPKPKAEPKPAKAKAETKAEQKPETKVEAKPEVKTESENPAPQEKPEPKPEPKTESKPAEAVDQSTGEVLERHSFEFWTGYNNALARANTSQSLKKAHDAYLAEKKTTITHPTDNGLGKTLFGTHLERVRGSITIEHAMKACEAAMAKSFA